MNKKLVANYIVREVAAVIAMGVILFWSAGQVDWWQAWAALGVMLAWTVATDIIIFRFNPALLPERLEPGRGAKSWDVALMSTVRLLQLGRYIVAGLDRRFGWTGDFPVGAQIAALGVCTLGYALVAWATASNAFFSQVVRVQSERGHTVVTAGPYRYLRHPAYLGAVLFELAVPVLLSSWWAGLLSGLNVILFIVRTALEDRTLQTELDGYADYARRARYRLLPGIW